MNHKLNLQLTTDEISALADLLSAERERIGQETYNRSLLAKIHNEIWRVYRDYGHLW